MASSYQSHSPPLSGSMRRLSVQNSRTMKSLDKELSRLDVERKNKMKELNQATRHFLDYKIRASSARSREASPDRCSFISLPGYARDRSSSPSSSRSPSPRARSPLDDIFPVTSPRTHKIVYKKSISTEERTTSLGHPSPSSSPESHPKLLSKRNSDTSNKIKLEKSHSITESCITHVACLSLPGDGSVHITSSTTSPRNKTPKPNPTNTAIPKIIVSDATPKLPEITPNVNKQPSSPVKKDSKDKKDSTRKEISKVSHHDATSKGSLNVPTRRSRSNSVPAISSSTQLFLQALATEQHTTCTSDDSAITLNTPTPTGMFRPRSSSVCVPYFNHLKDAPRRDSLLRKYIARPKIYHRTAKTIDHLISDLAKGIYREELLDYENRSKPITPEEWETLKKCRYLRMPSKDEDVTGNTLDVEAIFSE